MKKITIEAKTFEEAKTQALEEIKISEDKIDFKIIYEKKGILGFGGSVEIEAFVNVDPAEEGLKFLNQLFDDMGIKAQIEMRRVKQSQEIVYSINTNQNPILIGREGKTLNSIQYLLRNLINIYTDDKPLVVVDIGGYKANRKRQLEILATKTAKDVARSKVAVKLDPMNAFERRIIHTKLSEWRDVVTKSEGEKPNRYIVIEPKK